MSRKKKLIIWIIVIDLVIAAVALAVFLPRNGEIKNAEGSMNVICPVRIYQDGEIMKCPCMLRPQESCLYTDPTNCQYDIKNISLQMIEKGESVIVVRQKIQASIQYLEVTIPE